MKLYVFLFVVLVVLVQTFRAHATLTQSLSDNSNLKRLTSAWGKRMTSVWGKRAGVDSDDLNAANDDLYERILRQLYRHARRHQQSHPQYTNDNDLDGLTFEQLLAQRSTSNNDDDTAARNMS